MRPGSMESQKFAIEPNAAEPNLFLADPKGGCKLLDFTNIQLDSVGRSQLVQFFESGPE